MNLHIHMGGDHSQKVKTTPIGSDYSSKDCVSLSPSTTVSRIIVPEFRLPSDADFTPFLSFMENIIRKIIPQDFLASLLTDQTMLPEIVNAFNDSLPLLSWNIPQQAPCTLTVNLLCPSDFTSGVGRYFCDTISRWLVPGTFLNISSAQSLNFRFQYHSDQTYFLQQVLIDVENENALRIITSNQENLTKELRLNIMAVKHARNVIAIKKLSFDQKQALIQENIASVLDRPSQAIEHNVFDHMHHFLLHLSTEEKITQIKDQFTPFVEQGAKIFDRDIFNEIKYFVLLFHDAFTSLRDFRHLGRIISFQYLFRKSIQRELVNAPNERHLAIKLLRTRLSPSSSKKGGKTVLGILGGINVLRENELFEERHVVEAIQHCIPKIHAVHNSFILDRRSHDPIRIFYIEIEKENGASFTLSECKDLRKNLPRELKENIESVIHPVFMPRNEEEILRNILILSRQLKYVRDIPQVIITFDTQTEEELSFTIILLRLLKTSSDLPITTLFQKTQISLTLQSIEVKEVGSLRKKYPKQANVFTVTIDKRQFLRKDYTLDLFKARQAVSCELALMLGEIRDFNGGILSKQHELFQKLRESLSDNNAHQDFLLENFFYSLTPPLRQSILLPTVLKKLFDLLLESLEIDYKKEPFFLKTTSEQEHLLLIAASPDGHLKHELIAIITDLQIPASDLSFTQVNAYGVTCIGYIYHNHDPLKHETFNNQIHQALLQRQTLIKK